MQDEAAVLERFIKYWAWKAQQDANRPEDAAAKFVFLWICVNARLAYESSKRLDREMIDWVVAQRPEDSDLRAAFDRLAQDHEFQVTLESLIRLGAITDERRHANRIQPVVIKGTGDFEGFVRGVYQIRGNLFHGATAPSDTERIALCGRLLVKWVGALK